MGNCHVGSIIMHIGTNNVVDEGTTVIIDEYRRIVYTLKEVRVGEIVLSATLLNMGGREK